MLRIGMCVLGSLLIAFPASAQSKNDLIYQRGKGRAATGTVTSVSPDFISLKTEDGTEQIPVDTITRIMLKEDPSGLGSIRSAVTAGQLEQARSQLTGITSNDVIIKQELEFFSALITSKLALQGNADVNDAARQVAAFMKANPSSFRYYEACEAMGDLATALGRFDAAASYYGKLDVAKSAEIRARGELKQGNAWLRHGDPARALDHFQKAQGANDSRLEALAAIGMARCMAVTGDAAKGIQETVQIIKQNDAADHELFAQAYNALGVLYESTGQFDAALESFLHTDLLYFRDADAHAEALFHLVDLWTRANKPSDAAKARKLLKEAYATTSWAKK